jgi:hypothetical protein
MDKNEIRFLLRQIALHQAMQAVHCRLLVKDPDGSDTIKNNWLPIQSKEFHRLLFDRRLQVRFVKKHLNPDAGYMVKCRLIWVQEV